MRFLLGCVVGGAMFAILHLEGDGMRCFWRQARWIARGLASVLAWTLVFWLMTGVAFALVAGLVAAWMLVGLHSLGRAIVVQLRWRWRWCRAER